MLSAAAKTRVGLEPTLRLTHITQSYAAALLQYLSLLLPLLCLVLLSDDLAGITDNAIL